MDKVDRQAWWILAGIAALFLVVLVMAKGIWDREEQLQQQKALTQRYMESGMVCQEDKASIRMALNQTVNHLTSVVDGPSAVVLRKGDRMIHLEMDAIYGIQYGKADGGQESDRSAPRIPGSGTITPE